MIQMFPPHLNNVSEMYLEVMTVSTVNDVWYWLAKKGLNTQLCTLLCEIWNACRTCGTIELLQKETPELITPQLCLPNAPDMK